MSATSYPATLMTGAPCKGSDGAVFSAKSGTVAAPGATDAPDISTADNGEYRCDGVSQLDVLVFANGGTCTLQHWLYSAHAGRWYLDEDWGAAGSRSFASGDRIRIPHPVSGMDAGAFAITANAATGVTVHVLASEVSR